MKNKSKRMMWVGAISACVLLGVALAAEDRYTLKIPDGLAFADIKGYDAWQTVAVSGTETSLKTHPGQPHHDEGL